ncbi:MAG: DUF485 domain-containing protein [Deltaproteobacteria bacterium]|nr:DUF485 domain-containing protein [Deltaproteobacteria bacterium]
MSHGPASEWGKDAAAAIKGRIGAWLFAIYTVIYAGFVLINVLAPDVMDTVLGGQNLATVYGMGLIVLALILGIFYNRRCSEAEDRLNKEG